MNKLPVRIHNLSPPPLSELATTIQTSLQSNFKHATVTVSACPDLTQAPFNLAASGLTGNERIADIGGPPNLHPLPNFEKKYSLLKLMKAMSPSTSQSKSAFVIGAAAGPFHVVGCNSELIPNLAIDGNGEVRNLTHYAKIGKEGECVCGPVPEGSTDCAFMANLFGSEGLPGDVIKIVAKERIGGLNFLASIQKALRDQYGERTISMGGVSIIKRGKARMHVMPDFSKEPLTMDQALKDWLRFFEMSASLVCLTTFHSHDPGLDLRMEHTHCFSDHGEAGHYHADTTPEEVEYEAYLNTAKVIYRIDQPDSH